jgi:hypothetical protein
LVVSNHFLVTVRFSIQQILPFLPRMEAHPPPCGQRFLLEQVVAGEGLHQRRQVVCSTIRTLGIWEREMTDVEAGTAGKEVNVETPLGKFNAKGYHVGNVLQIIIAAAIIWGVFTLMEFRNEAKDTAKLLASTTKVEHDHLGAALIRSVEVQQEMNYILTLSPERRERLNLAMPESMRRRVIGRDP